MHTYFTKDNSFYFIFYYASTNYFLINIY